jgi:hypothetical protein
MVQRTKYHSWVKPTPSWVELVGFRRGKAAKKRKSRREGEAAAAIAAAADEMGAPDDDMGVADEGMTKVGAQQCTSCGINLPAGARFCFDCGAPQ